MAPQQRGRPALPANVKAVANRIEKWRRTRRKRSPMPEQLWLDAAVLARSHGVYRVSQAGSSAEFVGRCSLVLRSGPSFRRFVER